VAGMGRAVHAALRAQPPGQAGAAGNAVRSRCSLICGEIAATSLACERTCC
jgi:hypothetical protein